MTPEQPGNRKKLEFRYGAGGPSRSWSKLSIPLPKITRFKLPAKYKFEGVAASTEQTPSWGLVYMANDFRGNELTVQDIRGGCVFLEVTLGAMLQGTGAAMMFGMNPALLIAGMGFDAFRTATGYFGGALMMGIMYPA